MVRVKYRYFLCELVLNDFLCPRMLKLSISESSILKSIRNAILIIHGDYGVGATHVGLSIKMYNAYTRVFMLRARRSHYSVVSSSLPFVQQIDDLQSSVRLLHLGGTIRSCLKFLQQYDHEQLLALFSMCNSGVEKENIKSVLKTTYKALGVEDSDSE